ncbi:MAG: glycyl-radical enzyme activating protein [Provencibacterium sp.]|jgi:pyruvate formate lyase activating enzyme|nr:glycyl-radical enzyme activating protein [Provencibacterium sp.]
MTGTIFDIKEFSLHDGPGPRITVFLKGCPLRCRWCHNPEGLSPEPQLMIKHSLCSRCGRCLSPCRHEDCAPFSRCLHACPNGLVSLSGRRISARELADILQKKLDFYLQAGGGITFSGGEPLYQGEFLLEVLSHLSCHKAVQTSGYAPKALFSQLLSAVDYVMMDIKLADDRLHREYTGVSNEPILQNLRLLQQSGKPYLIRTPLISGICDTPENLAAIAEIIGVSPWEKLPENPFWKAKYEMLADCAAAKE